MADWPADGVTDWNTKMKANIDVGHDSDGTHKKSQMLTDMGWSPTTLAGEESITFPNGMIMKRGTVVSGAASAAVSFAVNFSTLLEIHITQKLNSTPAFGTAYAGESVAGFTWYKDPSSTALSWTAWGY